MVEVEEKNRDPKKAFLLHQINSRINVPPSKSMWWEGLRGVHNLKNREKHLNIPKFHLVHPTQILMQKLNFLMLLVELVACHLT